MTTIAAVIVGLASGYFLVMSRTAFAVTTAIMVALTALQTWHLASGNGSYGNAATVHGAGYWIVCVASVALALGMTWAGAKLSQRRHAARGQTGAIRPGNI